MQSKPICGTPTDDLFIYLFLQNPFVAIDSHTTTSDFRTPCKGRLNLYQEDLPNFLFLID